MAGSKRSRIKKALSPSNHQPHPQPSDMNDDDDELMNDLLVQLESRDHTVQTESANVLNEMNLNDQADKIEAGQKQDAKSRFKARQARKAAVLAQSYSEDDPEVQARLEKEAKDEADDIQRVCKDLSLEIQQINPDGHCFFSAVADQLALLGVLPPSQANYATVRNVAANFIHSHPNDFLPFLPSAGGEDGAGALDAGMMDQEQFNNYCSLVRDTALWGGEPEIVALSRAYNIPIHIVQGGKPAIVMHNPDGEQTISKEADKNVIRISYHRKLYGLGEHYNSLRPLNRRS